MQLTRFHVLVEDFPREGEHVLYNTLSDQQVGLDESALAWIRTLSGSSSEGTSPIEKEEIDWLRAERFLVEDELEDDAGFAKFMRGTRDGDGTLLLTLMVSRTCNMACPYCFEGTGPVGPGIGRRVEAGIHEWVKRYMDRHGLERLFVQYFGGEPLLRKRFILRTAGRFAEDMESSGRDFGCSIITNGLLLDRSFAERMVALGLKNVKVTLDGDQDVHDRWRVRRNGSGTFDKILGNLKEVAGVVPLRVGANVRPGHELEYEDLIDRLDCEGLAPAVAELYFKPVLDAGGAPSSGRSFSDANLGALLQLNKQARRSGMGQPAGFPLGPCGLHMAHYLSVDHDGKIYKCEATMDDPRMAVGSIDAEVIDPLGVPQIAAVDPAAECGDCAYLPACAGGCRAVTWGHEGLLGVNCERAFFETVGTENIKQRYLDEHYGGSMPSKAAA